MSAYISIFSITDIICLTEREKPIIPCGIAAWLHNHFDIVNELQWEDNPQGKTNQHFTPAWASVSFLQSAPHTTSAGHQCPTTTSLVFLFFEFLMFLLRHDCTKSLNTLMEEKAGVHQRKKRNPELWRGAGGIKTYGYSCLFVTLQSTEHM